VLPQRQPVLLAKQLSSLDVLSRGRLLVGIGVGYVEAELNALGASMADRAARTDEYLAAMRALWTGAPFEGRFVAFHDVVQRPEPVQRPHPPIVVAGHSRAAFRRAVTSGNEWYGFHLTVEEAAELIAGLREVEARTQRPLDLGELRITITPTPGPIDRDTVRRFADLGVHRLVVQPESTEGPAMERLIASVAHAD
jgi:alkanesulfonate monooxygenase SsuD/methylene tetrahydromethanopterin reductase-like flavin-dependent oxidoreductase (luciferase family)